MPDFMWLALVLLLGIISLAIVLVCVAGAYLLVQLALAQRLEAKAQWDQPVPLPTKDDQPEEIEEARVNAMLDAARGHGGFLKTEWMNQKRAEGWEEEEIDKFLAERPLLELN